MLTPEQLKKRGYKEFSWNNGTIMEYWKPIFPKRGRDCLVCVRFGEHNDYPFMVYIIAGSAMLRLKHLQTINEVEALYALLRQP
jgi:hypothetical protein